MKKTLLILIVLVAAFAVFAQSMAEKPVVSSAETKQSVYTPETEAQKFFWALGYYTNYSNMSQYLDMDAKAFAEGARAYADGETLTEEELTKIVEDYNAYLSRYVTAMAEENLREAEAFLAKNATEEGVVTTQSGLQYKVIKEGTGATPAATDTVNMDYELTLLDGTVIDSSFARGVSADFALGNIISGLSEGICLMKTGGTYRFWIHPSLGYGENGTTNIEPNKLLVFDVALYSIAE